MALFFPYGINGPCLPIDFMSRASMDIVVLPAVEKIVDELYLSDTDYVLFYVEAYTGRAEFVLGNMYIEPIRNNLCFSMSVHDNGIYLMYVEDAEDKERIIEFLKMGGLNG